MSPLSASPPNPGCYLAPPVRIIRVMQHADASPRARAEMGPGIDSAPGRGRWVVLILIALAVVAIVVTATFQSSEHDERERHARGELRFLMRLAVALQAYGTDHAGRMPASISELSNQFSD